MAAAILWWALTRLERKLDEFPTAMRENTKATSDFTSALRELKGEVSEVARDVEALRDNTGQHRIRKEG